MVAQVFTVNGELKNHTGADEQTRKEAAQFIVLLLKGTEYRELD